jgi:CRP/FNR family cyclic AMP-dependent transcriptional regulator
MNCSALVTTRLKAHPFFSSFNDSQLTWILAAVKECTYGTGQYILRAGETPQGVYVLLSGRVRLLHQDSDGRTFITSDLAENDLFGEMGIIDATRSPASIVAVTPCEVALLPRKIFLECIKENNAAAVYVLRMALERLCAMHEKVASLALTGVRARVARVLLDRSVPAERGWRVEPGAEEIAELVGASREMVSRVIKGMILSGAVLRQKRKLLVLDRAAVAAACAERPPMKSASANEGLQHADATDTRSRAALSPGI